MTRLFRGLPRKSYLALTLASLLGCIAVAQTVTTSHTLGADFSKYRTYRWVSIKGQNLNSSLDSQIKQSFDSQLAAKGLKKIDGTADLYVDYQTAVSKVETWQVYENWSEGVGLMDERLPQRKKVMIDVGALVIDMYDTAAKQLVWTGRIKKTLNPNNSQDEIQNNLDKAAKKMLADFPPK